MPSPSPAAHRASVMRSIVRENRRTVAIVLPLSTLTEAIEMLVPILLGLVIDAGIVHRSIAVTVLGALGIVALRVLGTMAWSWMFSLVQRARMGERHRLRVAVTGAVLDPRSRPIRRPAGEVLSIATSDADKASDVLDMLAWGPPATATVLGSCVWLAILDPWLGLATLVGIVVMVAVVRGITPVLSARYDAQQSGAADAAATATDLVHGLRVLQGLGVQSRARAHYRARSQAALRAALVNARYSGLSSGLTTLVTAAMMAAVVIIAAQRAIAGEMTIGTLIAVVGVARSNMGMLQGLSEIPVWWASMSTSARRVRDLLGDLGRSVDDPALSLARLSTARDERGGLTSGARRPGVGSVRLRGLPGGPIAGLDLTVGDGEVAAVACADPRAADAIVRTLTGRAEDRGAGSDGTDRAGAGDPAGTATTAPGSPSTALPGTLDIGGEPVAPEDRARTRADLLVEPHVVDLFDGTLRAQLATRSPVARDAADDRWADAALHAAGAEDLLGILPDGYDTRILDRGANLSGGQRQRIALARAVAADPPVLVLQDPTTAVDAVTEQRIAEALVAARADADRATLLITRSPALLAASHRVVLVEDGRVAAHGTHHELMGSETYREMVQR